MNRLRHQLTDLIDPDNIDTVCRTIEQAILEDAATRYPADLAPDDERANHGRALGMYDAADLIKGARINHDPDNVPGIYAPSEPGSERAEVSA